jgi:hypothetical protein
VDNYNKILLLYISANVEILVPTRNMSSAQAKLLYGSMAKSLKRTAAPEVSEVQGSESLRSSKPRKRTGTASFRPAVNSPTLS